MSTLPPYLKHMHSIRFPAFALLALSASAFAQNTYGPATPGSGGFEPLLSSNRAFVGNANFRFDVQCGFGNSVVGVVLAAQPAQFPLLGATILIQPGSVLTTLTAALTAGGAGEGMASFSVPIPGTPSPLLGVPLFAQALIIDPGVSGGLAASRGLRFEINRPPLIFIGTSILQNDPYHVIDPGGSAVLDSASPVEVDNCSGAVFADGGERLYVASNILGTVSVANTATLPLSFSTIHRAIGTVASGLAHDPQRGVLWTLTEQAATTVRELVALDADASSPNFGAVLYQTTGFGNRFTDVWALSKDGTQAAVLEYIARTVTIVDTDPQSPTFLINRTPIRIPQDQPGFSLPTDLEFTPDGRQLLITVQVQGTTPGEVARLDVATGLWFDHNPTLPGQQNISPLSTPRVVLGSAPTSIDIDSTGRFAILSGFGGCGWIGRLDIDPKDRSDFAWNDWTPSITVSLANSWTAALSGDETEVGVTTWPRGNCNERQTVQFLRFDATAGVLLSQLTIPFNSNPQEFQNLYRVVYR